MTILTKGVAVPMPVEDLQTVAAELAKREVTIKRMWRLAMADPEALAEVQAEMKVNEQIQKEKDLTPSLTVPKLIDEAVKQEKTAGEGIQPKDDKKDGSAS